MATLAQLSEELARCEAAIQRREREVRDAKRSNVAKLAKMELDRQALLDAQAKRAQAATNECEWQVVVAVRASEEEAARCTALRAKCVMRTIAVNALTVKAETRAQELLRLIRGVSAATEQKGEEEDRFYSERRAVADLDVARVYAATEQAVQGAALYASEVQEQAIASVEAMQEEARHMVGETDFCASQRSRLTDLVCAASEHDSQALTPQKFQEKKGELVGAWHRDWAATSGGSGKFAVSARALSSAWSSKSQAGGALSPSTPRPRAVELAHARALAGQDMQAASTSMPASSFGRPGCLHQQDVGRGGSVGRDNVLSAAGLRLATTF